jgi:hypothetical protein
MTCTIRFWTTTFISKFVIITFIIQYIMSTF